VCAHARFSPQCVSVRVCVRPCVRPSVRVVHGPRPTPTPPPPPPDRHLSPIIARLLNEICGFPSNTSFSFQKQNKTKTNKTPSLVAVRGGNVALRRPSRVVAGAIPRRRPRVAGHVATATNQFESRSHDRGDQWQVVQGRDPAARGRAHSLVVVAALPMSSTTHKKVISIIDPPLPLNKKITCFCIPQRFESSLSSGRILF